MSETENLRLPVVLPPKPTVEDLPPEQSIEDLLAVAQEREAALRLVLRALLTSMRPFGFNRAQFKRCVAEEGQDTPTSGPKSARHAVLHQEARRVLREAR